MALSDSEIRDALSEKHLVIEPFEETSLNPAGYDLRLATSAVLEPSEHRLVATMERVELGRDLVGILHIRSSLAREGVLGSLALVDPGFRGQLTISLFNSGKNPIQLKAWQRGRDEVRRTIPRQQRCGWQPPLARTHGFVSKLSGKCY